MLRPVLASENMSSEVLSFIGGYHRKVIAEIEMEIAANKIVVVGMRQNPFVKRTRHALSAADVDFKYLEYGSYLSMWKPRLAIKMWSGWPTYPQVFVDGKLIGGFRETAAALKSGAIMK